jgi:ADP-ribosylglycohydrolase
MADQLEDVRPPAPTITETLLGHTQEAPTYCFNPALGRDRARSSILGAALGDAFGLQVEGDSKETIRDRYPDGLQYPYNGARRGYPPLDWTDATDFTVLVMRTLAAYFENRTDNPATELATHINEWNKTGFPELGDTTGFNAPAVVMRALSSNAFVKNPVDAARSVMGPKADNGALIRTPPCAFTAAPVGWALVCSEMTHADERCAASAITLTLLLNQLSRLEVGATISASVAIGPIAAGRDHIANPARKREFMHDLTNTFKLSNIELGERDNRSYTIKTLRCAMWTFRRIITTAPANRDAKFFRTVIEQIATEGGDASANCAVAGAMLGSIMGVDRLPADWLEVLPHRKWLNSEIDAFIAAAEPTWTLAQR